MLNLFAAAVSNAKSVDAAPKTKNDKIIIPVSCGADLDRLHELRGVIKDLTAEQKMLEGNVKSFGKQAFLAECTKAKRYIGSFHLKGNKSQMLFIPQDKYLSELPAGLPAEITEQQVVYEMDAEIVEKYGEELSKAIMGANIPDELKSRVITATPKTTIKKGSIDRITEFPSLADFIVYQLKG